MIISQVSWESHLRALWGLWVNISTLLNRGEFCLPRGFPYCSPPSAVSILPYAAPGLPWRLRSHPLQPSCTFPTNPKYPWSHLPGHPSLSSFTCSVLLPISRQHTPSFSPPFLNGNGGCPQVLAARTVGRFQSDAHHFGAIRRWNVGREKGLSARLMALMFIWVRIFLSLFPLITLFSFL